LTECGWDTIDNNYYYSVERASVINPQAAATPERGGQRKLGKTVLPTPTARQDGNQSMPMTSSDGYYVTEARPCMNSWPAMVS
jgi:hypothetical protein